MQTLSFWTILAHVPQLPSISLHKKEWRQGGPELWTEVVLAISNPSRKYWKYKKAIKCYVRMLDHCPKVKKMFDNLVKVILDKAPSCCIDGPICAKHCVSGTSLQIPGLTISNHWQEDDISISWKTSQDRCLFLSESKDRTQHKGRTIYLFMFDSFIS